MGVVAAWVMVRVGAWLLAWVLAHAVVLAAVVVSLVVLVVWLAIPCLEADEVDG